MSPLPLPTTPFLKTAAALAPQPLRPYTSTALNWFLQKLDPLSVLEESQSPSTSGEDPLLQEHEAQERKRRLVEIEERVQEVQMSRMSVPVLAAEVEDRVWKKGGKGSGKGEVKAASPAKEYDSAETETPSPERMLIPTLPSRLSSPFLLTGSEFMLPTKVRISPQSQERVARELQEAMASDFFKVWPMVEDEREGKEVMEESGMFVREMGEGERLRREELMREWKDRQEREGVGRRRVGDGEEWESVVEGRVLRGVEGFRPALGACFEDGEGILGVKRERKGEKSRETRRSTRDSAKELTREKEIWARRDHRERKSSKTGNEKVEGGRAKENRQTHPQPQSKTNQGSKIGNSKAPAKTTAKFRPWSKDRDGKENSEDNNPFYLKPRDR